MPSVRQLKPLRRPLSLHVSVQESLRGYIEDNQLKAGDALATGVIPRSAARRQPQLCPRGDQGPRIRGGLETRRGIGVFVKAFSFQPLLDNLAYGLGDGLRDIEELRELRRVLETGLIHKTVEMIGEEDLAALRQVTERMRQRAERNESFVEEDEQFHRLLFRCQNNRMLTGLIEVFWRAFYKAVQLRQPRQLGPAFDMAGSPRDR